MASDDHTPPIATAPGPETQGARSVNTVPHAETGALGVVHAQQVTVNNTFNPPAPPAAPSPPLDPLLPPAGAITWRPAPDPPRPDPANPYPVLHPIKHPDALGGRQAELAGLVDDIDRSDGLLALYAPSGQGKSSLVISGLVPHLRGRGTRTALHRRPDVPGLGRRLVAELITDPAVPELPDDDPRPFAAWIDHLARAAGHAPVLVLDQFEAIFKVDPDPAESGPTESRRPAAAEAGDAASSAPKTEHTAPTLTARARVGLLLAATVDPGGGRAKCRWVLAYREEFHGRVQRWLGDVLAEAPQWRGRLAGQLTPDHTLLAFPLPPLGGAVVGEVGAIMASTTSAALASPAESSDAITKVRFERARHAFADAIDKPLAVADGGWHFETDGIERLAGAFAAARCRPSDAPLVPELQVVLGRLVREARAAGRRSLVVPEDVGELIHGALRWHLVDALRRVFEARTDKTVARTMALLALRRLADEHGRAREAGLPRAALRGLADDAVLDALGGPEARLVVPLGEGADARVRLSHDRLAAVLAGVDHREVFGPAAGFDPRLIDLAGRVGLRAAQYADTRDGATLALGPRELWRIARNPELLWDAPRRRWWGGVKRRVATLAGVAVAALVVGALIYQRVQETQRRTRIDEAVAQVSGSNSPEAILTGLQTLIVEAAAPETIDRLIDAAPLAAAEATPDRAVEPARARFIRRRLGGAAPATSAQDFGRLIAGVEAGRHPETPGRLVEGERRQLRGELRAALRRRFPGEPPVIDWQPVGAGSFMMGDHHGDGLPRERPVHRVTLPAFELARAEVSMGEYRAFDPAGVEEKNRSQPATAAFVRDKGEAADRLPMWMVDWHEAWAFALWADPEGRLPTETEWEYAARGGPAAPEVPTRYWAGDDTGDLLAVAWVQENSGGRPREVCQPPDPARRHALTLCDMHGNLYEWVADWQSDSYPEGPATAPAGPRRGALRVSRGGSFLIGAVGARSASRGGYPPGIRDPPLGFRLARSAPSSEL